MVMLHFMNPFLKSFDFLFQFDEPTSRLYHINILSNLLVLFIFAFLSRSPGRPTWALIKSWIFKKNYWWNRSTKQDYFIYIFNGVFKTVLVVPLIECSFLISRWTSQTLFKSTDDYSSQYFSTGYWSILIFSVAAFIFDDLLRFLQHLLMHRIPLLWKFHQTHHSARILTPITLYRAHPVESVLAVLRNSLSLGISSGVFIFLFGSVMSIWTILGVNGLGFTFNLIGANLRHSHIRLGFGWLEHIVISPLQHQIHHSKKSEHYDKNFGVTLAIWDQLGGTLMLSKNIPNLKFGLSDPFNKSFLKMLSHPFQRSR